MLKKYYLIINSALIILSGVAYSNVYADTNADISISTHIAPNVFGRIDIGSRPPPPIIYERPVVVYHRSEYIGEPIYMHVPREQYQSWNRYCHRYDACSRKVYFIQPDYFERPHHHNRWHRRHEWHDRIRVEEPHNYHNRGWGDNGRHRGWDK